MYAAGDGVPEDHVESLRLVRLAAEQGYWEAHYRLGFLYRYGGGVPEDHAQAHMWFNLAASHARARRRASAIWSCAIRVATIDRTLPISTG